MKTSKTIIVLLLLLVTSVWAQDNELSKHFGFDSIEHIKMRAGIVPPILADINGDGLVDMVIINNSKARIDLLLQKKGFNPDDIVAIEPSEDNINDIFGREQTWRFKRVSYPVDYAVLSVVVADLNNDGVVDLAYYTKDGLFVASQHRKMEKGKANPTVIQWDTAVKYEIEDGLASYYALNSGDMNSDGLTDLILSGKKGAYIFDQAKDGSLANARKCMISDNGVRRVYVADVDGDEKDDLVFLGSDRDYPIRVRFQVGKGQMGPENRYQLPSPGALEVVPIGPGRSHFVYVAAQSGRVGVATIGPEASENDYPVFMHPLEVKDSAKSDVINADLNGDGLEDIIITDPGRAEFVVLKASKSNTLSQSETFPGLKDMVKLCVVDLNKDGKDEIIALSIEEKIIGVSSMEKGRLSYPKTIEVKGEPKAIDVADVNGDGKEDLVYITEEKNEDDDAVYYLRKSICKNGKLESQGDGLKLTEVKDPPSDIVCCDVNNDGDLDVLVFRAYDPPLLISDNKEQTSGDIHSGLIEKATPANMSFGPLGENGKNVMLLAQGKFSRALVFDNDKGWQVVDQYQTDNEKTDMTNAIATKLDGKKLSIVSYDSGRNRLVVMDRQSDDTYRAGKEIELGAIEVKKLLAGDFGGDSEVSLLLCGAKKIYRVPVSGKTHKLSQVVTYEPELKGAIYGVLAVADINDDQISDIVLGDHNRNYIHVLTFNENAELVEATKFRIYENPRGDRESSLQFEGRRSGGGDPKSIAIRDVTNDGKNDLILLVNDRILIYPQD
ncbi:MAG: VCBS repeat-containing protein [Phycisphaerae bacterium]|nr:VCBS repeat-containing protein [Phycisphaerae bacterium]